ncbi:hypothetical protein FEM48_Zijuj04G0200800 [Ziziphus jujuba var. spinosa]|uniref:Uncharacterized protein n=1 Tax=Ziziphus jujuba var. spinosa TaxID=714518 RepID=A0A978VLX5_ZIZJJ|nr:hypothetical protein FEM48_Zijuj04G0200800 [Ziziphus jujuba var. spinosa]
MKESIVLYPAPVFHHMVSMVELGKLILRHHHDLSITILVPTGALDAAATSSYIHQLSQTDLSISFFTLRSIQLPQSLPQNRSAAAFQSIQLNAEAVVDALGTISATSKVLALITSAVHSSYHPHIPTYYYFSSCASTLAFFLHLPTIHNQTSKSFKDLNDTVFHLPGLPPIKASDMPDPVLDRNQPPYHYFIHYASCLPNSKGFIVNTFEALEPQAIKAITDGTCVLDGGTPPIYHIGPLITDSKEMRLAIALEKVAVSSSSLSSSSSSTKEEMVSAEELKKKVRELMGQEGQGLRERSLAMKSMAMAAWSMDGSSLSSLSKMVASWKQGH